MKKLISILMVMAMVAILISFAGCSTMKSSKGPAEEAMVAKSLGPVVLIGTPMVKMNKKAKVVIMGTGFKPGQELHILFTAANGVQSDIAAYIKPELKVDKTGTWATSWNAGRYVRRKIIKKGGAYAITVTGSDYLPIATAPVCFYKEKKKKK